MKAASLILQLIGFLICFGTAIGFRFAIAGVLEAITNTESSGIGMIASALATGTYMSYLNILGCVIILLGIILNIISIIIGRKRNN